MRPSVLQRDGLLRRGTDRAEDLAAWLLTALALLAVLGAVAVGLAAHHAALPRGPVDVPTPVRVVLLTDVTLPPPPPSATAPRVPGGVLPRAAVAWTAPDGTVRTGELAVRRPLRAGAEFGAWVDRAGRLTTSAPRPAVEAAAFGVGAGLATAAGAWVVLALLWLGVRRVVAARNDAAWAREWARVEPLWSRRVR